MNHLSWLEAAVVGALQGVSELFPVSSLGHSVLVPALVGGTWARDLSVSSPESPYLAFIVGTHVATAIALLLYFRRDWVRIIGAFFRSLPGVVHRRPLADDDQRLAWMLVLATIPVGLVGLLFEHWLRTNLGRPIPTACFLIVNGVILFAVERFTRGARPEEYVDERVSSIDSDRRIVRLSWARAILIGASEIAALAPGISRAGIATATGMTQRLSREDAARFSFLLATPVIFAAGALKIPDLFGPMGDGIRPQILFGSVLSGIAAYLSVRFLTKYFATRSLNPFAAYCVLFGAGSLAWLSLT